MSENSLDSPDFSKILSEYLNRLEKSVNDSEIAKLAEIDSSTLSILKNKESRIKNPNWDVRVKLAVAIALKDSPVSTFERAETIAERFISATPRPANLKADEDWRMFLKNFIVKSYQSSISEISIGLPLFFDTAPFIIAEREGYFSDIGLNVKFDYVKWHKAVKYLKRDIMHNHNNISDSRKNLRLTIYNQESIATENEEEAISFKFPLAIYKPKSFVFWVKDKDGSFKNCSKDSLPKRISDFLKYTDNKPKIIVSGTDMKRGVKAAFDKAGKEIQDSWFVTLDQFDAVEIFCGSLGNAFVGGVPQKIALEGKEGESFVELFTGNEFDLPIQYNGIVSLQEDKVDADDVNYAIVQILWGWYQAIKKISDNLEYEAKYIVDELNVHTTEIKYEEKDFINFWYNEYFYLPAIPSETIKEISKQSYYLKMYDETNTFYKLLKKMEPLLSETK